MYACALRDEMGVNVREKCPMACDVCTTNPVQGTPARSESAKWWEAKHAVVDGDEKLYTLYDREQLFTVGGFIGSDDSSAIRCEESDDTTNCPCIFPFYYEGEKFTECAVFGNNASFRCPTSLTNADEHLPGSQDVRDCSANEVGDISRLRRQADLASHPRNTRNQKSARKSANAPSQ